MTDLFIKFKDENSLDQSIPIDRESFVIGRHSQNDLTIPDARLSRKHIKIDRFADVFVVSDLGSSNGTKLNERELTEPAAINNGDILDLGGVRLEVEILSDEETGGSASESTGEGTSDEEENAPGSISGSAPADPSGGRGGSILSNPFILAPVLGVFVILLLGLGILIVSLAGGSESDPAASRDSDLTFPDDGTDPLFESPANEPDQTTDPADDGSGADVPSATPGIPVSPDPSSSSELSQDDKLRGAVIGFMRSIAQRDPNPVITSEPLRLVDSRIRQFRGSPVLAANINNARSNSAQIRSLAATKNMRPEFVAAAAIAKLGNSRGDVAATAGSMIDVLSKLKIQIGDAFANEAVIIIAAYDQGSAGEYLAMRDTMTKLADANPTVSSRKVRTVWFLKEQGKLTDAQFEFALRFLAVGAIAQDPSEFGVNAQPLSFN